MERDLGWEVERKSREILSHGSCSSSVWPRRGKRSLLSLFLVFSGGKKMKLLLVCFLCLVTIYLDQN